MESKQTFNTPCVPLNRDMILSHRQLVQIELSTKNRETSQQFIRSITILNILYIHKQLWQMFLNPSRKRGSAKHLELATAIDN